MPQLSARRRWAAVLALLLGILVVGLDVTILNVALPTLAVDLDASTTELQWIVDAFIVVLAALLLPAGLLADRVGRKKVLLAGLVVFGIACVTAVLSDTVGMLIAARTLMGAGAAVVMPVSMSVVPSMFTGAERTRAVAVLTAGMAVGLPLGPLVGGWLLEHYWWGSVFLVNIPLIVIGIVAVAAFLPESVDHHARRLQPVGVIASAAGLAALVYGVIAAPVEGWTSAPALLGAGVGLVLIAVFVISQLRAADPMVDLGLFGDRAFLWGSIVATAGSMVLMGALFLVPQYLQVVEGNTAFGTGLRLLPLIGGLMVGGLLSERLAAWSGYRVTVTAGLAVLAAGCLVAATTDLGSGFGLAATWLSIVGAGLGLAMVPATDAVLASLPADRAAVGSALMQTMRQAGGAIGVAVLGSVATSVYVARLGESVLPPEARRAAEESVAAASLVAERLDVPEVALLADQAYVEAMAVVFVACAVMALAVMAATALWFPATMATEEAESEREPTRTA